MKTTRTGLVLFVKRYKECIEFYRDILKLEVMFKADDRICLAFGMGYLMLRKGGVAKRQPKAVTENPAVLRFNVDDLDTVVSALQARTVKVLLDLDDGGRVARFHDPDGNLCELRDEATFMP